MAAVSQDSWCLVHCCLQKDSGTTCMQLFTGRHAGLTASGSQLPGGNLACFGLKLSCLRTTHAWAPSSRAYMQRTRPISSAMRARPPRRSANSTPARWKGIRAPSSAGGRRASRPPSSGALHAACGCIHVVDQRDMVRVDACGHAATQAAAVQRTARRLRMQSE